MTQATTTPNNKPQSMNVVLDGIIDGVFFSNKTACSVCGHETRAVQIQKLSLPTGIEVDKTILRTEDDSPHAEGIGVGCGCYAKFHRQVAHIQDKMAARLEKKDGKVKGSKDKKKKDKKKKHGRQ